MIFISSLIVYIPLISTEWLGLIVGSSREGELLQCFQGCWGNRRCFSKLMFPLFLCKGHISCTQISVAVVMPSNFHICCFLTHIVYLVSVLHYIILYGRDRPDTGCTERFILICRLISPKTEPQCAAKPSALTGESGIRLDCGSH